MTHRRQTDHDKLDEPPFSAVHHPADNAADLDLSRAVFRSKRFPKVIRVLYKSRKPITFPDNRLQLWFPHNSAAVAAAAVHGMKSAPLGFKSGTSALSIDIALQCPPHGKTDELSFIKANQIGFAGRFAVVSGHIAKAELIESVFFLNSFEFSIPIRHFLNEESVLPFGALAHVGEPAQCLTERGVVNSSPKLKSHREPPRLFIANSKRKLDDIILR